MGAASSTEDRLIAAALEARDSDSLLQLCRQLDTNLTLTVGGYAYGELEQSVTHHVTCKARDVECFRVLIERLGPRCLTRTNMYNQTPVHCAALAQDASWLKLINETLGSDCFLQKGEFQRTAIHYAAMNTVSNSSLKWLVEKCGRDTLTEIDEFGDTPVYLAAQFQGSDSMQLIKTQLGFDGFHQCVKSKRSAIHGAAMNAVSNAALKWLIKDCGLNSLTVTDQQKNTPVHLAAWQQTKDSLQFVDGLIGIDKQIFFLKGFQDLTVAHQAAQNASSNSAFLWCIRNLGSNCLLEKDSCGRTPAHLAAKHQDLDSLCLIHDSLGNSAFGLKDSEGKTVEDYARMNAEHGTLLLEWLEGQRLQQRGHDEPGMQNSLNSQAQTSLRFQPSLDPDFASWEFILNDAGKKQLIGEGAFGRVFKAFTDRHQTVAVKIVKLQGASGAIGLHEFIEQESMEISVLKRVRHPNIVLFLKSESTADCRFCIFTELIAGHSLSDLMQRQRRPFDESGVKKFSLQICLALSFLHCEQQRPIVHRDIKCSNIMLSNEGLVKLIDFGLAKEIVTSIGKNMSLCGTWYFMAPELFDENGRVVYTPKTDVWALGCTVFEMLAMKPPNVELAMFQIPMRIRKQDLPELPGEVSDDLSDFYCRCVLKEPEKRADVTELLRHAFLQSQLS